VLLILTIILIIAQFQNQSWAQTLIYRVGISSIPFETAEALQPKLTTILEKYGNILELDLRHTVDDGWFNGRRYVTLNRDKNPLLDRWPFS
jgi:hypothetical protein